MKMTGEEKGLNVGRKGDNRKRKGVKEMKRVKGSELMNTERVDRSEKGGVRY